jgi:tetratricopeptide (TPR) repeat protein
MLSGWGLAHAADFASGADTSEVVALPAVARHVQDADQLDVAGPLAEFYIRQSRSTGDLAYLDDAEALLAPWVREPSPDPRALLLHATVQQSRHEFVAALATLDRTLALRPTDARAWLTRATILRSMGLYAQAGAACERFAQVADTMLSTLCRQSLRALNGELPQAYGELVKVPTEGMRPAERAWLESERGDMAVRLGRDADAERWFRRELKIAPDDMSVRAAYADLLLRHRRAEEVLVLLRGQDGLQPLLLRIAIAQKMLGDPGLNRSVARLQAKFRAEAERGVAVHWREQARFFLEVQQRPQPALAAAIENWKLQREPDDVLIYVKAAASAGNPQAARPALDFVRAHRLTDARLSRPDPL